MWKESVSSSHPQHKGYSLASERQKSGSKRQRQGISGRERRGMEGGRGLRGTGPRERQRTASDREGLEVDHRQMPVYKGKRGNPALGLGV